MSPICVCGRNPFAGVIILVPCARRDRVILPSFLANPRRLASRLAWLSWGPAELDPCGSCANEQQVMGRFQRARLNTLIEFSLPKTRPPGGHKSRERARESQQQEARRFRGYLGPWVWPVACQGNAFSCAFFSLLSSLIFHIRSGHPDTLQSPQGQRKDCGQQQWRRTD